MNDQLMNFIVYMLFVGSFSFINLFMMWMITRKYKKVNIPSPMKEANVGFFIVNMIPVVNIMISLLLREEFIETDNKINEILVQRRKSPTNSNVRERIQIVDCSVRRIIKDLNEIKID